MFTDLTGNKYGRLTVVSRQGTNSRRNILWLCQCDCGNQTAKPAGSLKIGDTKSCGCLARENSRALAILANQAAQIVSTKHGMCGTPIYRSWSAMKQRCFNPKNSKYSYYGGAGITVCERWLNFQNFLDDMGASWKPGLTLDRFPNGKGNYEPGNVRWATKREQSLNRFK